MYDLYNELQTKINDLDVSVKMLRKSGADYAEAYTNYRIALSKELLLLRDQGVAVTLAYDVARGKPEIAKLKFNEISKEAIYKANQESINSLKLQIRIIESQISREWQNPANE